MKVDVVIPSFCPDGRLVESIGALERQTLPVNRIIVMNTEKKEMEKLFDIPSFLREHPRVFLTHLARKEFDHGRTRNRGVAESDAEIFVCMTQDALAADACLLERLVGALFQKEGIAAAYARQLPERDCNVIERFTRQYNYPERPRIKGKADIPRLGIRTFFCSNVCAAYRRDIFDRLGMFVPRTIFNEDMIYAARAVKAGYEIAYAADAQVIHSHNYTVRQQFSRNFDLGVSHAQYPEIFADVPPEGEGARLVKKTALYLFKNHPQLLPKLVAQSGAKLLGYRLGKRYEKLPRSFVKGCSSQKYYWE